MENLVLCPRCEESGIETPVLPDQRSKADEDEGVPPVARCGRCDYVFCALCLSLYHGKDRCLAPEEKAAQAAMRRLAGSDYKSAAEKRKLRREAERGYLVCIDVDDDMLPIDAAGHMTRDQEPNIGEGDRVIAVHAGIPERITGKPLWDAKVDNICTLSTVLMESPRPLSIRLVRTVNESASQRLRQRRLMEELLTLREIARQSQPCPKCKVPVNRSMGCNHMQCTQCRTHFCYRCGIQMDAQDPYAHFKVGGCKTFDDDTVQQMALQERHPGFIDHELEELRQEFGDQRELFVQFQRDRGLRAPDFAGGRGSVAARRRMGDVRCPTCGQWNSRVGNLNHIRCGMCRNSYCGHCRRRIQGVTSHHYRGETACPQHFRVE